MKKKMIAAFCALILLASVAAFAACGNTDDDKQPDGGIVSHPTGHIKIDAEGFSVEEALRSVLRSLTLNYDNAAADFEVELGHLGKRGDEVVFGSREAVSADGKLSYDRDDSSVSAVLDFGYSYVTGDDRSAMDKARKNKSVSYYKDGYKYFPQRPGEYIKFPVNYQLEKRIGAIFDGAYVNDLKELYGIDLFSDWTFAGLRDDIEALPVGKLTELINSFVPEDVIPDIFEDNAAGDVTISEVIDGLFGVINAFGVNFANDGVLGQLTEWLTRDIFNFVVAEKDDGYTLTITDNEIASTLNGYIADLRKYMSGSVDNALKGLLNIDASAAFKSVRNVLTGKMTVDDGVKIIENALSPYGVGRAEVYGIIAAVTNTDVDTVKENLEKYYAMKIDDFIEDISKGEYDYASLVGYVDTYLERHLKMTFVEYINNIEGGRGDDIYAFIDKLNINKADLEVVFSFDSSKALRRIVADADLSLDWRVPDSDVAMDFGFSGSMYNFGSTKVNVPDAPEYGFTQNSVEFTTEGTIKDLIDGKSVNISVAAVEYSKIEIQYYYYTNIDGLGSWSFYDTEGYIKVDAASGKVTVSPDILLSAVSSDLSKGLSGLRISAIFYDRSGKYVSGDLLIDAGKRGLKNNDPAEALKSGSDIVYETNAVIAYRYAQGAWIPVYADDLQMGGCEILLTVGEHVLKKYCFDEKSLEKLVTIDKGSSTWTFTLSHRILDEIGSDKVDYINGYINLFLVCGDKGINYSICFTD